jgi:hypothetical protein
MSKRLEVVLTEEEREELGELIQYTLAKLGLIVEKHNEVMSTEDVNVWRSFLDELLMIYVSALMGTHIEILQNTMDKLTRRSRGSGII